MNHIIRLSDTMLQRLDLLASATGSSRDQLLERLVEEGLEDIEADLAASEIERRIEDGTEAVYSSADVRRALGLDD